MLSDVKSPALKVVLLAHVSGCLWLIALSAVAASDFGQSA
jgi:hypothetical protein